MAETFGARLRRLREAEGLTYAALAEAIGTSEGALRQLEAGNVQQPGFATGLRLATVLRVDPYELAFGDDGGSVSARLDRLEARLTRLEARKTRR